MQSKRSGKKMGQQPHRGKLNLKACLDLPRHAVKRSRLTVERPRLTMQSQGLQCRVPGLQWREAKACDEEAKAYSAGAKAYNGEAKGYNGDAKVRSGEIKACTGKAKAYNGETKAYNGEAKANAKADSTLRSSQAVPHPSTDRALRRLTSEVERDPVHSTWYGRQRNYCSKKFNCLPFCLWGKSFHAGWEA